MMYEQTIRDAIAKARQTGCTGHALEKHVAEYVAKELGCESMGFDQLALIQPDFERLVWPITRPKTKQDDQPKLF
jgi:hypothetical protein